MTRKAWVELCPSPLSSKRSPAGREDSITSISVCTEQRTSFAVPVSSRSWISQSESGVGILSISRKGIASSEPDVGLLPVPRVKSDGLALITCLPHCLMRVQLLTICSMGLLMSGQLGGTFVDMRTSQIVAFPQHMRRQVSSGEAYVSTGYSHSYILVELDTHMTHLDH